MVARKIILAETPTAVPKDKQQSLIWFLTLENVSGSEIHARMRVVYGYAKCYHKINSELISTEIQGRTTE